MESYPVDLTLFHRGDHPEQPQKPMDIFNGATSFLACRLLEYTSWYNANYALRLLGHYRLFQIYKKKSGKMPRNIPIVQAYILQYRSSHGIKYFLSKVHSLIISIGTLGEPSPFVEIHVFNSILLKERFSFLEEFLNHAEKDFTAAFRHAMYQISQPGFMDMSPINTPVLSPTLVRLQQDVSNTEINTYNTYNHNEINFQTAIQSGAKGKEKGVFSKWQTLVFFDLFTQAGKLEKFDLTKPNKFKGYAEFLHAISGKSIQSWIDVLRDYQGKDLYEYHTHGQLDEIINNLKNLSAILRAGDKRSLMALADKKIIELERKKNN